MRRPNIHSKAIAASANWSDAGCAGPPAAISGAEYGSRMGASAALAQSGDPGGLGRNENILGMKGAVDLAGGVGLVQGLSDRPKARQ